MEEQMSAVANRERAYQTNPRSRPNNKNWNKEKERERKPNYNNNINNKWNEQKLKSSVVRSIALRLTQSIQTIHFSEMVLIILFIHNARTTKKDQQKITIYWYQFFFRRFVRIGDDSYFSFFLSHHSLSISCSFSLFFSIEILIMITLPLIINIATRRNTIMSLQRSAPHICSRTHTHTYYIHTHVTRKMKKRERCI